MAKDQEREDKLLGAVMSYLINGKSSVTFKLLAKNLDFMERTTTWRNSWRTLIETKGFIAPIQAGASVFTGEHQMTEAGKTHASTPEYEEYLKELNFCPQTNQEHQERIKKRLSSDSLTTRLLKFSICFSSIVPSVGRNSLFCSSAMIDNMYSATRFRISTAKSLSKKNPRASTASRIRHSLIPRVIARFLWR